MPVLFVHGIGGTPRDFAAAIAALDPARFEPWVAHYASRLPLETSAAYLDGALAQLELELGIGEIAVVAHSMGGLVARRTIQRRAARGGPPVRLLVTLATPWGGQGAAQLGVDAAPVAIPVWHDMAPGSPFLDALAGAPLPAGTPHHLFFAYGGGRLPSLAASDGTVTLASQLEPRIQAAAARLRGYEVGHTATLSDPQAIAALAAALEAARVP